MKKNTFSGAMGVEIPMQTGRTKYSFPRLQQLEGKKILWIMQHNNFGASKTPNNYAYENQSAYVSLCEKNTNKYILDSVESTELRGFDFGNVPQIRREIDFERSFFEVYNGANLDGKAKYFVIFYEEPAALHADRTTETDITSFQIDLQGRRTYFFENNELSTARYRNILMCDAQWSPDKKPLYSSGEYSGMFLTLQKDNVQFFSNVPLSLLRQHSRHYYFYMENIMFDFRNSYIENCNNVILDKTLFFNALIEKR
ncbi:MAG: hypothetical protein LBS01_04965 [Prevotellaceae bacterium]|jgi:hypothetical protein|nr:hypothetical protein [Prevotellaceae bacterium]